MTVEQEQAVREVLGFGSMDKLKEHPEVYVMQMTKAVEMLTKAFPELAKKH